MKTFIKAQVSSFVATGADFCITIVCAELLRVNVVASAAIGNVAGAGVNFLLGRQWVFTPLTGDPDSDTKFSKTSVPGQAIKYAIVWLGYMALATFGIYLLETYTSLHYIFSKMLIGLTLAVTYNYFLQKKFVFN